MKFLVFLVQVICLQVISALRFQGAFTDPSLECAHCHGKELKGNSNMGLRARVDRLSMRRKEEMMRESSLNTKRRGKRLRGNVEAVAKAKQAVSDFYQGDEPKGVGPDVVVLSGAVRRLQLKRSPRGKRRVRPDDVVIHDGAADHDGESRLSAEGVANDIKAVGAAKISDSPNVESRLRSRGGKGGKKGGKKGKKGGKSFQPPEEDSEDPQDSEMRTTELPNSKSKTRPRGGKKGKKGGRSFQPPEEDSEVDALAEDPVDNAEMRTAEPPNSKSRPRGGKGGKKGKKGGRALQRPELDSEVDALAEGPVDNEVKPLEPPNSKSKPRPRGGKGGKKGKKGGRSFQPPEEDSEVDGPPENMEPLDVEDE